MASSRPWHPVGRRPPPLQETQQLRSLRAPQGARKGFGVQRRLAGPPPRARCSRGHQLHSRPEAHFLPLTPAPLSPDDSYSAINRSLVQSMSHLSDVLPSLRGRLSVRWYRTPCLKGCPRVPSGQLLASERWQHGETSKLRSISARPHFLCCKVVSLPQKQCRGMPRNRTRSVTSWGVVLREHRKG